MDALHTLSPKVGSKVSISVKAGGRKAIELVGLLDCGHWYERYVDQALIDRVDEWMNVGENPN